MGMDHRDTFAVKIEEGVEGSVIGGQEIKQGIKEKIEQEAEREVKQEVEGDISTPMVPEDVVLQEDVKPVLTHAAVQRSTPTNIKLRPHDQHRRRTKVCTTTSITGPGSRPAPVPRPSPKPMPVAQPPNSAIPTACPQPEVTPTLEEQQVVPRAVVRMGGRYVPKDPALQKAELARFKSMCERREADLGNLIGHIMKSAEESENRNAQFIWQAGYSQLWSRKSSAEGAIERLDRNINYKERDIAFAEVSQLRFQSHLTKEERAEITSEANANLAVFSAELEQLHVELAAAKASLILRNTELDNFPGPESVGLPPRDGHHHSRYY